ncbi:GGDEF domain-containing protein [Pseudohaliea rubra]|uniref:diguanylate cyclase n=1 Tax=Pseudohaliea rubra DSM 19751 TaxID=1265313 RepID=A0A095VSJ3_9GAMM|nr:GGDEF domain-containing protein [Pseudohaliea rubra]KGE04340.1 response regulator receiver modulated diguanylate cyclase [Pseudohaliea rubra DSM 19751]
MPLFPPDANPPLSRWRLAVVVAIVAWQSLNTAALHAGLFGNTLTPFFPTPWAHVLLKTLAAVALGYAAIRGRNSPTLPSLTLLCGALALGAWSSLLFQFDMDFYRAPGAPWADVLSLVSYALICLAILWLPTHGAVFTSQRMLLTDLLIALGAFALLVWEFVLLPSRNAEAAPAILSVLVEVGYPVLNAALLSALLLKFPISRLGPNRVAFRLLATAVLLLFLADTAFGTHLYLQRSETLLLAAELLYSFAAIGMLAAGLRYARATSLHPAPMAREKSQIDLSPVSVAMMVAVLSALFFEVLLKDEPSKRILLGTGALMMLLLYRQMLTHALRKAWMEVQEQRLQATVDERTRELAEANRKLEQLAELDALTGLPNRRALERKLNESWQLCARLGEPLTVALIDIDFFKPYNDNYGHPEGDKCLRAVAQALAMHLRRSTDMVARYGGEEFAVVMPLTAAKAAAGFMEDLRAGVAARHLIHEHSTVADRVTVSIGLADAQPKAGTSWQSLLDAADKALYAAKDAGRNRVQLTTGASASLHEVS